MQVTPVAVTLIILLFCLNLGCGKNHKQAKADASIRDTASFGEQPLSVKTPINPPHELDWQKPPHAPLSWFVDESPFESWMTDYLEHVHTLWWKMVTVSKNPYETDAEYDARKTKGYYQYKTTMLKLHRDYAKLRGTSIPQLILRMKPDGVSYNADREKAEPLFYIHDIVIFEPRGMPELQFDLSPYITVNRDYVNLFGVRATERRFPHLELNDSLFAAEIERDVARSLEIVEHMGYLYLQFDLDLLQPTQDTYMNPIRPILRIRSWEWKLDNMPIGETRVLSSWRRDE